jgi:uncharacterized protein YggE
MGIALAMGMLSAASGVTAESLTPADHPIPQIRVVGAGRVQAAPDTATLDAGVTSEAVRAKDAIGANATAMQAVLEALHTLEIDAKDIQTQQLQLAPVYPQSSGGRRAGIGSYRATSRVRVRVREIDDVGGILDALVDAGANQLGNVTFTVAEPDPLLDRARRAAVADGRRKAMLLAREAGMRLGEVLEIHDSAAPRPFARGRGGFAAESAVVARSVPIASGELEFSAQVEIVYALRPSN